MKEFANLSKKNQAAINTLKQDIGYEQILEDQLAQVIRTSENRLQNTIAAEENTFKQAENALGASNMNCNSSRGYPTKNAPNANVLKILRTN